MVRNLLLICFVCVNMVLTAQISTSPNPLTFSASALNLDTKFEIYITNSKDTAYNIYWQLVRDGDFPVQWTTYVCDLNLCYGENVNKSANSKPNVMPKGTHKFDFHIVPNGYVGASNITLKLFTEKNMGGEIYSTNISLSTTSSSTKDQNLANIKVYPNPASDYFQIGNSGNVYRVVLYNLFGKEVKSFFHYNNAQHEIGDLKAGMYVAKLFDAKGKAIKSIKLNKIYGGA